MNTTPTRPPAWLKLTTATLAAILLLALAGNIARIASGPETLPTSPPGHTTARTTAPAAPPPPTQPTPTPAPLGDRTWQAALDANAATTATDLGASSPAYAVTHIETVNSSTIRVHIQDHLADDGRDDLANWVLTMSCEPDLQTIIIRDTTGRDSNHHPRSMRAAPLCD